MKKEDMLTNMNTYLIVALVIVVAIGLYFTLSVPVVKKEAPQAQASREIMLTVIGGDCKDCFNVSIAVDFIKQQNGINVTGITDVSMENATELIAQYNITRLPALVITGNTSGLTIPNFDQQGEALVFSQAPPPYYDVQEKKVKGEITITTLTDATCTKCFDMSTILGQLKQVGVQIASEQNIDAKSEEGKALIAKYNIEKIPSLIFNADALEYDVIKQVWNQVGTQESDGSLVLRFVNPPYINVSTGKTEGLVTITYLADESCKECFNASVYGELIGQSFNMQFETEEILDVSSTKGKFLVKKYNITNVPATILSKEASAYPNLATAWNQVGTQESDGAFVFRNVGMLKSYFEQTGEPFAYKDLNTNATLNSTSVTEEAEIEPPSPEET